MAMPAAAAYAQQARPSNPDIVVNGDARYALDRAERELNGDEVASYGLNSVGSLLAEIMREGGHGLDDAVLLINGQRTTNLGDVDEYPTEAIERLQLLPQGSGPKFGGAANRRVINIVLKAKTRTSTVHSTLNIATEGDWSSRTIDLGFTDIKRPRRMNITFKARQDDPLRESDRGVNQPTDANPDLGKFRTLRPDLGNLELKVSLADHITPAITASITSRLTSRTSRSLLGLTVSGDTAEQRNRGLSGDIETQFNGQFANWLVLASSYYRQDRRLTRTDALDSVVNRTVRTLASGNMTRGEISATRPIGHLPAGPISLTIRAEYERDAIFSNAAHSVQNRRQLGVGVQIPLLSVSQKGPNLLGELSAAIEIRRSHVSYIGALTNITYTLNWDPRPWLRLSASLVTGRTPPTIEAVAGPLVSTPGVRSIDPLNGDNVDILEVTGGNPLLRAQRDDSRRLSVIITPFASNALVLSGNYSEIRNRDVVTAFPAATPSLLLAFPERFVRTPDGQLVLIDVRPLNFARQNERQLRTGLEFSAPVGPGRGRAGRARLQFSINHAWILNSSVQVREGTTAIDLLSRNAFGLGGAAQPRHEVGAILGYARRGFGVRMTAQYRSASYLALGSNSVPDSLRFSPLTTFNVRAFIEGQRIAPSAVWLKGTRFTASLNNISAARETVRDLRGGTPLRYQPTYLDPVGRTVLFELRKAF